MNTLIASKEIAKKHGINTAVVFQNIAYWINYNKKHGVNYRDGNWWTYFAVSDLQSRLEYLTDRSILRALKTLKDEGYLVSRMFDDNKKVRSNWYALTEKGWSHYIRTKSIVEDYISDYKTNPVNPLENGFEKATETTDKLSQQIGQNVTPDMTNCHSDTDKLSQKNQNIYNKNIYKNINIKREHSFVITNSMLQDCVITNILSHASFSLSSSSFLNFYKIYSGNLLVSDKLTNSCYDKFQSNKGERYPIDFTGVIQLASDFKKLFYETFAYQDCENLKDSVNQPFSYGEYEVLMSSDKRKVARMKKLISLTDGELFEFALEYPYTFNLRISQAVKKITKERIKDFNPLEIIRLKNDSIDALEEKWIESENAKKLRGGNS